MTCCGCSDEESKVMPSAEQHENRMSSRESDEIFVKDRSCTDLLSLFILIALVGGFAFMMHNAVKKGDIYRIIYGYDECANVCGRITPAETDPKFQCKGKDLRAYPYLRVSGIPSVGTRKKECVASCSSTDQIVFLNRCVSKDIAGTVHSLIKTLGLDNFYKNVSADLQIAWKELIYLILIALTFSLSMLIAFRYLIKWIVYIVLIGVVVVCIGGTAYLWLAWYSERKAVQQKEIAEEDSSVESYFVYAIIISVVTVITVLIVLVMRKRIALVMQLFREAGKAVYDMPALLFQPIYTYLMIGLITAGWIYAMLWIESAGDIYRKQSNNHLHYQKDALLIATRWYNIFFFFVLCEFVIGCQHMVVALSVARWFFKRDKSRLFLTVTRAFYYLVRYHLGTVAFGALVIGIIRLIRAMIAFIQKILKKYDNAYVQAIGCCCQCCFYCFEVALKFFTRNAYIETAIYGCNFCTGGSKAFQALSSNILRVTAINSVGDFVLFLGKVLVVTLTVVTGIYLMEKKEGLQHPWVPITIAGLVAFLVSHCFISIYEMIIDSIFICFCEDCTKNDGISRPYFMSRGLMEFVENSKKALQELNHRESGAMNRN